MFHFRQFEQLKPIDTVKNITRILMNDREMP